MGRGGLEHPPGPLNVRVERVRLFGRRVMGAIGFTVILFAAYSAAVPGSLVISQTTELARPADKEQERQKRIAEAFELVRGGAAGSEPSAPLR